MRLPKYRLEAEGSLLVFGFISQGPKGRIAKKIKFAETRIKGVYNLSFGDLDPETREIDDRVVSNNGDSEMVLTTVIAAVYAFADRYPEAAVFAKGSTNARTRLYRMGITKYMTEIKKDFFVFGGRNEKWGAFEEGIEYDAFLVKRKKLNLEI